MRTARRFVYDESGMTMALAVIMIVLIGVMGAGLLTFVMKDLSTVTQENTGQKALGIADAGVAAAKSQLLSDCSTNTNCKDHYDDTTAGVVGAQDILWSDVRGGLTLNNLDGDGNTSDCVKVQISATGTYDFKVTSTGYYHSGTAGS